MPVVVVLGLGVVLSAFVAYAISRLSNYWAQALVGWLATVLGSIPIIGGVAEDQIVKLARWIANAMGRAASSAEHLVASWLGGITQYVGAVAYWATEWPKELQLTVAWLLNKELPRLIAALPHVGQSLIHALAKQVKGLFAAVGDVERFVLKRIRPIATAAAIAVLGPWYPLLRWLAQHAHTLGHAIPRAIHFPKGLTRKEVERIANRAAKVALTAGVAAAVVAALRRLGLNLLRCRNVKRTLPRLCGMDANLLDSLLLDSLAIFSVISVVEFANDLRGIEDEAVGILHRLIREFPAPPATTSG